MPNSSIRQKLHRFIDNVEDKGLKPFMFCLRTKLNKKESSIQRNSSRNSTNAMIIIRTAAKWLVHRKLISE
jgi:hypothetical protein